MIHAGESQTNRWWVALVGVVLASAAVLSGCTTDDPPPAASEPEPAIDVRLSFTQLLPDEGTPKGLLRVVNESEEPLPVTGAGLSWSGYGPAFTRPQDATLAPGQTLDLRVLLPRARCDGGEGPVRGIVATADGRVEQPLTASGQEFLRRLWLRGCQDSRVEDNVGIAYADGWAVDRVDPSVDGALVLRRRDGREPVTVTFASGSVLYDVELPRRVTLAASQRRVLVPMRILPGNRCDEHAIGQATAPFTFRIGVRVGAGDEAMETNVLVPPPVSVQEQATRMLLASCARASG